MQSKVDLFLAVILNAHKGVLKKWKKKNVLIPDQIIALPQPELWMLRF